MSSDDAGSVKNVMQVLAIFCMIAFVSILFHKGYTDIAALAEQYSGQEFWRRLGRYLIANLAGG
jgi:hypothetical protein